MLFKKRCASKVCPLGYLTSKNFKLCRTFILCCNYCLDRTSCFLLRWGNEIACSSWSCCVCLMLYHSLLACSTALQFGVWGVTVAVCPSWYWIGENSLTGMISLPSFLLSSAVKAIEVTCVSLMCVRLYLEICPDRIVGSRSCWLCFFLNWENAS